jgi:hypothetical protein
MVQKPTTVSEHMKNIPTEFHASGQCGRRECELEAELAAIRGELEIEKERVQTFQSLAGMRNVAEQQAKSELERLREVLEKIAQGHYTGATWMAQQALAGGSSSPRQEGCCHKADIQHYEPHCGSWTPCCHPSETIPRPRQEDCRIDTDGWCHLHDQHPNECARQRQEVGGE